MDNDAKKDAGGGMHTLNQQEVAERIRFLISKMHVTQGEFARRLGLDPANLSKQLNGKLPITRGLINRISADMGVSKQWLSTGHDLPFSKGALRRGPEVVEMSDEICVTADATGGVSPWAPGLIPVYDIDVTAGCRELSMEFTNDRVIGSIALPEVRPGCVIVKVNGDSMSPAIQDGAFVAIRPVSDLSCIFWGQIYVIVLEDYRMLKYVRRNDNPHLVTLRSDNPDYDDMEIERSKIKKLYIVETVLNLKIRC